MEYFANLYLYEHPHWNMRLSVPHLLSLPAKHTHTYLNRTNNGILLWVYISGNIANYTKAKNCECWTSMTLTHTAKQKLLKRHLMATTKKQCRWIVMIDNSLLQQQVNNYWIINIRLYGLWTIQISIIEFLMHWFVFRPSSTE